MLGIWFLRGWGWVAGRAKAGCVGGGNAVFDGCPPVVCCYFSDAGVVKRKLLGGFRLPSRLIDANAGQVKSGDDGLVPVVEVLLCGPRVPVH